MTDNTKNKYTTTKLDAKLEAKLETKQELKWSLASQDLKKALDDWQTATVTLTENKFKLSPDEKMLADMQQLLMEIKTKLHSLETMYEN